MPSSDPIQRFEDILENILRIERYTAKIGDEAENLCPGVPWAQLRGLGNFLRHEYDRVDPDRMWLMVERDLDPLKTAVEATLVRLRVRYK